MIEKLTTEQEAKLPHYRDEGIKVGLSCKPIDFDESREIMDVLADGKKYSHEYTESPLLSSDNVVSIYGSLDSPWIYNYMFFKYECGIDIPALELPERWVKSSFIVSFNKGKGVLYHSERPEFIKMQDGVLHCEDGPSIRFKDGKEVYSWRGTNIDKKYIMDKENIPVEETLNHPNVEIRRCIAEILGWSRVLDFLPNKVIDKDSDPEIGTLIEVNIPEVGREKFMRVTCATGREFAIPVPKETRNCYQGQGFMFGMTEEEFRMYKPSITA